MPADTLTLFRKFFNSSIRRESMEVRFVFIGLIAMANDHGIVEATPDAIAAYVNMCPQAVWTALTRLSEPDPDSTTPDEDGRRIVSLGPHRWRLVTHDLYAKRAAEERASLDALAVEEDAISKRREQFRLSKQKARAAKKQAAKGSSSVPSAIAPIRQNVDVPHDLLTSVDNVDASNPQNTGQSLELGSSKLESKSKAKSLDTGASAHARIYTADSPEMKLAQMLFGMMRDNNPRAKEPNLKTWAKSFDLLLRRDSREYAEVEAIIRYSQTDTFWMRNVLSPDTLRKQYDRLKMQMGGKRGIDRQNGGGNARTTRFAEWDD